MMAELSDKQKKTISRYALAVAARGRIFDGVLVPVEDAELSQDSKDEIDLNWGAFDAARGTKPRQPAAGTAPVAGSDVVPMSAGATAAIRKYQQDNGLPVTGVLDEGTLAHAKAAPAAAAAASASKKAASAAKRAAAQTAAAQRKAAATVKRNAAAVVREQKQRAAAAKAVAAAQKRAEAATTRAAKQAAAAQVRATKQKQANLLKAAKAQLLSRQLTQKAAHTTSGNLEAMAQSLKG